MTEEDLNWNTRPFVLIILKPGAILEILLTYVSLNFSKNTKIKKQTLQMSLLFLIYFKKFVNFVILSLIYLQLIIQICEKLKKSILI